MKGKRRKHRRKTATNMKQTDDREDGPHIPADQRETESSPAPCVTADIAGQRRKKHARRKRAAEDSNSGPVAVVTPERSLRSVVVKSFSAPSNKRRRKRRLERKLVEAFHLERWTPFSPEPPSERCTAVALEDYSSWSYDTYRQDNSNEGTPEGRHNYESRSFRLPDVDAETEMRLDDWDESSPQHVLFRPSWSQGSSQPPSYICLPSYSSVFRHRRDSSGSEGPYGLTTIDSTGFRHRRDSSGSEGPHRLTATDSTGFSSFTDGLSRKADYSYCSDYQTSKGSCSHRRRTYQSLHDRGMPRCIVSRCTTRKESRGWEEEEEAEEGEEDEGRRRNVRKLSLRSWLKHRASRERDHRRLWSPWGGRVGLRAHSPTEVILDREEEAQYSPGSTRSASSPTNTSNSELSSNWGGGTGQFRCHRSTQSTLSKRAAPRHSCPRVQRNKHAASVPSLMLMRSDAEGGCLPDKRARLIRRDSTRSRPRPRPRPRSGGERSSSRARQVREDLPTEALTRIQAAEPVERTSPENKILEETRANDTLSRDKHTSHAHRQHTPFKHTPPVPPQMPLRRKLPTARRRMLSKATNHKAKRGFRKDRLHAGANSSGDLAGRDRRTMEHQEKGGQTKITSPMEMTSLQGCSQVTSPSTSNRTTAEPPCIIVVSSSHQESSQSHRNDITSRSAQEEGRGHRSPTPPLIEHPITFSAEEMDKYRHLQQQARQHMQCRLQQQDGKVPSFEEPSQVSTQMPTDMPTDMPTTAHPLAVPLHTLLPSSSCPSICSISPSPSLHHPPSVHHQVLAALCHPPSSSATLSPLLLPTQHSSSPPLCSHPPLSLPFSLPLPHSFASIPLHPSLLAAPSAVLTPHHHPAPPPPPPPPPVCLLPISSVHPPSHLYTPLHTASLLTSLLARTHTGTHTHAHTHAPAYGSQTNTHKHQHLHVHPLAQPVYPHQDTHSLTGSAT